ncbi:hypothetical protein conserved [Leishmania donovani]|uniref:Hypothetical_protein_conserved n=1 Tax=Leishmania donovani TaxID=5661 RepID=A0A3S7WS88_LEIDO|nr:hypothetical protein, conserved [Leishmania donovani]AYU77077.1 hypothetical protein LdCL_130005300 [Leishmania donovani]TPP45102.1 hypothetical protein CGC21_32965 [Leishmania donovani]TPP50171.1 hypothetical protein CGC20_17590 [Leishmania donovani]CAJ1987099.1 hypothetical protein conserved [Leishmania donovani]CBZ32503.1 hypothetical protein, conserved [Leishmania donovani]
MAEPRIKQLWRAATEVPEDQRNHLQHLYESIEQLSRRCRHLENASERKSVVIEDLRAHVARLEELFGKSQGEMAYAQQQLEFVVMSLESQHGIVADHTEQLRLFAGESTHRGYATTQGNAQRSLLLLMGNWLYTPVVHFAKGVYTLFSPIITTAQSLSLLNSDVLHRNASERLRWGAARKGDLLGMLQRGALDPDSAANRK